MKVKRGSIEGAIEVRCAAKTNGFQFDFHWKTFQLPLKNVLISIGKRSALGLDVLQRLVGAVGKAALMGAQLRNNKKVKKAITL